MKKVLIGCGVAAVCALVLVILFGVVYGPRMARWGGDMVNKAKDEIGREQARMEALQRWPSPAPDTPAEALFPVRVGTGERTKVQDGATLGALGISRPGRTATYAITGTTIEVWAYPVNDLEKDGLMAQIRSAHDRSSGAKTMVTLPSRASFSSPSIGTNHVVTPPGWLLVFRPHGEADPLSFIDAFLRTADASSAPAPEGPAPGSAHQ